MLNHASWISPEKTMGEICPIFRRKFSLDRSISQLTLEITAIGVYEAFLDDVRIGNFIMAPGWTSYQKRLQVQTYHIPFLEKGDHELRITVAPGWYRGRLGWTKFDLPWKKYADQPAILLELSYGEDHRLLLCSDDQFDVAEGPLRFCEIYDGEDYDSRVIPIFYPVRCRSEIGKETLIPQEGEYVTEQEHLCSPKLIKTPCGEYVLDFKQEITGCVRFTLNANSGDEVWLSFGEVLDQNGNFYRDNYRSARAQLRYTCKTGIQSYQSSLTFYGFRYVRLDRFPGTPSPEQFEGIVVHSQLHRTGHLFCGDPILDRFLQNTVWGQKGNYLDIPTDCPQRDERLGWMGDAQVFVRAASYHFDVERFFTKWLADLSADQKENGLVPKVVPDLLQDSWSGAAWGDAAVICPWEIYRMYGNKEILQRQFLSMKKWLNYITSVTKEKNLWVGCEHHGDWLGLDAPSGSYKGSSNEDLIASAYYYRAAELVAKAGHVLGADVTQEEILAANIKEAFQKRFESTLKTQTEFAISIYFNLVKNIERAAKGLEEKIHACGDHLETGFVGTPYLLHALSQTGRAQLAYTLLLRREYPSWLYPVTKGATTVWEHWDGIMPDGNFWSTDMNSFNHYAYGAVADWVYGVAAGIQPVEEKPGFEHVRIAPIPDSRVGKLFASFDSRHGKICSEWWYDGETPHYRIETPVPATIVIQGVEREVPRGTYLF